MAIVANGERRRINEQEISTDTAAGFQIGPSGPMQLGISSTKR